MQGLGHLMDNRVTMCFCLVCHYAMVNNAGRKSKNM